MGTVLSDEQIRKLNHIRIPMAGDSGGLGALLDGALAGILPAESIGDAEIDWGTGTGQVSAADMPIADAGTYFSTDTVEAALQQIMSERNSVADGTSGADKIGATAISGWAGATVQAILESAKSNVDLKKGYVGFGQVINAGNITASVGSTMYAIAPEAGRITEAGLWIVTPGVDATDPLSYELDVLINGTTIWTTKPKLTYNPTAAAENATTFIGGTGITIGAINSSANVAPKGAVITYTLTRTATTPDTEAAGAFVQSRFTFL